jgi:hypothetical protein
MKITFTEEELTNIRALYNMKESNKGFQVKTNDEMAERIYKVKRLIFFAQVM